MVKARGVMNILHNKPIYSLPVPAVHSSSFNELGFDAVDGVRFVVGVKVDGDCVDHFES
jgi:hypothetical protein